LSRVPLVIVATATTTAAPTAKPLSAATLGAIGFGLRFVNLQRASAQFRPVQSRNGFIGFAGICHFHERKAASAAGFAVGDNADFFDRPVGFENTPQF
jgi:hypothetical protein